MAIFGICFMFIAFIAVRNLIKAIKDKECLWSRDRYGGVSALPIVGLVVSAFFFLLEYYYFLFEFRLAKNYYCTKSVSD